MWGPVDETLNYHEKVLASIDYKLSQLNMYAAKLGKHKNGSHLAVPFMKSTSTTTSRLVLDGLLFFLTNSGLPIIHSITHYSFYLPYYSKNVP